MFQVMQYDSDHGNSFAKRKVRTFKVPVATVEFACRICQRKFTKPYNLMIHERAHKDDVTFTCDVCGKVFKRQDYFRFHRTIHHATSTCRSAAAQSATL